VSPLPEGSRGRLVADVALTFECPWCRAEPTSGCVTVTHYERRNGRPTRPLPIGMPATMHQGRWYLGRAEVNRLEREGLLERIAP